MKFTNGLKFIANFCIKSSGKICASDQEEKYVQRHCPLTATKYWENKLLTKPSQEEKQNKPKTATNKLVENRQLAWKRSGKENRRVEKEFEMPARNVHTETFQIKSRKPARESVGLFADKSERGT